MYELSLVLICSIDNVATTIADVEVGQVVTIGSGDDMESFEAGESISLGHKIAVKDIRTGHKVVKYGKPIGKATCFIRKGAHVHFHNLVGLSKENLVEGKEACLR